MSKHKPLLFGTEELYASLPPKYRKYLTGTAPIPASLKKVLKDREHRGWVNVMQGRALNPVPVIEELAAVGKRYKETRTAAVKTRREGKLDGDFAIRRQAEMMIKRNPTLLRKAFVRDALEGKYTARGDKPGRSRVYRAIQSLDFPGDHRA